MSGAIFISDDLVSLCNNMASKKVVRAPQKVVVDAIRDKIRSENPNCPNKDTQTNLSGYKNYHDHELLHLFSFFKAWALFLYQREDFQKIF